MNRRSVAILAACAVVISPTMASVARAQASSSQPQTVKLGMAGPLTGAQAQYGKDFQSGVQLAVDDFNATRPVVDGKETKFVIVGLDDQADPRTGTVVAQRLVDEGIRGMIGHFNSGVSIPASAIYDKAGIPQVSMATAPALTQQGFKTTFRMMTSDTQQGSALGRYVVEQVKAKRIAIIDDRTAYGQGLAEEFEKSARAAGGNVVGHEFTTDKAVDFKAILTGLKSKNPDFIFYAGADAQSAPLIKQARGLAMKAAFGSGEMTKTEEFLKIAGPAAEGAIVSLAGLPLKEMPGGAGFAERYKARFSSDPATYAPYAYDGAMVIMRAMQQANSSDPKVYLPALAASNMKGVTSDHFSYDERGDLKDAVVTVYQAEGGKWVPRTVLGQH